MKINGKWQLNETPTMKEEYDQTINVTIKGVQYDGIDFEILDLSLGAFAIWAGNDADEILGTWDEYSNGWESEAHRTWDFGAAYQEVSDEFYTWLTANAVQLTKPIPMTHPKGILLLTAGKKCMEDIEVVPTFAAAETIEVKLSNEVGGNHGTFCYTSIENGAMVNKLINETDPLPTSINAVKNSYIYWHASGTINVYGGTIVVNEEITDADINEHKIYLVYADKDVEISY